MSEHVSAYADVHDAEAAGKELCVPAAGESTALPTQVELKEMLHRVDCAERSITQGIPVSVLLRDACLHSP